MGTKYIILFILFNVHTIRANPENGAESLLELSVNKPICTTSGVRCHNCWTSLNCIDLGNNTFHPNMQYCPMGRSCKNKTGLCESEGNYECSDLDKLECHTEGVFPSPFNNMEYITCVRGSANTLLKFISRCSPSYIFDPIIKLCSQKLEGDDSYSSLIPVCKFEKEAGAIKRNPNIFYRCEKETVDIGFNFIPHMYGCDYDLKFNGTDCIESNFMLYYFDENEECIQSGYFPHVTNSRKYYYCENAGSIPLVQFCPGDKMFSFSRKNCLDYSSWKYYEN